jgi:Papain family cysteine protease
MEIDPTQLNKYMYTDNFESVLDDVTIGFVPKAQSIAPQWPQTAPPVGNQDQCGCCWAYSLAKVATARYYIHTNQKQPATPQMFSVDDVINCTSFIGPTLQDPQGNPFQPCMACNGGMQLYAWYFLMNKGFQLVDASNSFDETAALQNTQNQRASCTISTVTAKPYPVHPDPTDFSKFVLNPVYDDTNPLVQVYFNILPEFDTQGQREKGPT